MTDNPITMQEISNRDRIIGKKVNNFYVTEASEIDDKPLNTDLINTITRPVNNISAEQFMVNSTLNKASINANCMHCLTILIELMEENTKRNGLYYSTIQKLTTYFINNVLRNLTSGRIDYMKARVNNDPTLDSYPDCKKAILDTIEDIKVCDRIVKNKDKISNRFDVNKVVLNNPQEPVEELCSLLDTYNIPLEAKYNIAIENIPYALYCNNVSMSMGEVLEHINNYYLNRNLVITDSDMKKISNVLRSNKMITKKDVEISGSEKIVTRGFDVDNWSRIVSLAEGCTDKECKKIILSIGKIRSERDASVYINETMYNKFIQPTTNTNDRYRLYVSAYCIPLVAKISKEFIKNEMNKFNENVKKSKKIKNSEFDNYIDLSIKFKQSDDLNAEYICLINMIKESYEENKSVTDIINETSYDDENEYIDSLIKKFKAEQDKNPNKFKAMVNKIYSKSPESIIYGLPDLFGAVRFCFVFSSATIPILGPVIAAALGVVDHLISTDISFSQSKKLYKFLLKEKEKIKSKSISDDLTSKKAKMYTDAIDRSIDKVKEYTDSIDSEDEEIEKMDNSLESAIPITGITAVFKFLEENNVETNLSDFYQVSITEGRKFDPNTLKLALKNFQAKAKELNAKQKQMWVTIDNNANRMVDGITRALTNDRREAIIKGSIIPSFSKCIKSAIFIGGASLVNPVVGIITAFAMFATSSALNAKEKALLYDEIDVELQVVEKQINIAENDGDMNQYRFLLTYQRKLQREKQRIKYGIKAPIRNIPGKNND